MTIPPLSSSEDESARIESSSNASPSQPAATRHGSPQGAWVLVPRKPTEAMLVAAGATPAGVMPRGGRDYTRLMLPKWWGAMLRAAPQPPSDPSTAWRGISSAPRDGTEIVFIGKYGHCSDVMHWRPPYTKLNHEFPGRFENWSGQATGQNDDLAWLFWIPSPLPGAPS